MTEYPHPSLPFLGETSVPQAPPVPISQFTLPPSPHPWGNYNRNYSPFPNVIANNFGTVGPRLPPQGNGHEANVPQYNQGGLSAILKEILSHRIAHPNSEVVAFQTEISGNGKSRVTVTFETFGGGF